MLEVYVFLADSACFFYLDSGVSVQESRALGLLSRRYKYDKESENPHNFSSGLFICIFTSWEKNQWGYDRHVIESIMNDLHTKKKKNSEICILDRIQTKINDSIHLMWTIVVFLACWTTSLALPNIIWIYSVSSRLACRQCYCRSDYPHL